jgi:hypothetical protein
MDQVVGKKKTSLLAHAPTTGSGTWAPWAPVGGNTVMVGMPPFVSIACYDDIFSRLYASALVDRLHRTRHHLNKT